MNERHYIRIEAMTTRDLLAAIDHNSDRRSRECTPNLYKFDEGKGVLDFVTRCSKSKNSWYQRIVLTDWEVIQEMLKEETEEEPIIEEEPIEEELGVEEEAEEEIVEPDESLQTEETEPEEIVEEETIENEIEKQSSVKRYALDWNEVKSLLPEVLETDIKVHCTCPAHQYWGSHYILDQLDSAIEPESRYPGVRDPNMDRTLCKHLIAVLRRFFV